MIPVEIVGTSYAGAVPSMGDIMRLPVAVAGRYDMTEAELGALRQRIYSLNHNHVRRWKWRTAKLPAGKRGLFTLIVWRVR